MRNLIKFIIKKIFEIFGYEIHKKIALNTQKEINISLYDSYPRVSIEQKKFYNIGSGLFNHPYWTNIDYATEWYKEIQIYNFINLNLMDLPNFPIENNSAELFYTSHTIEHITNQAVLNIFKECFRALKESGGIRIVCPDSRLLYESLKRNDILFWDFQLKHKDFIGHEHEASIYDCLIREIASERCRFSRYNSNVLESISIKKLFESLSYEEFMNTLTSKCKFNSQYPGYHLGNCTS